MLTNAIQQTINPLVDAYTVEAFTEEATPPLAIHLTEGPEPMRNKEGISGYMYRVTVQILHADIQALNTLSNSVASAVDAIGGTTVDNTIVQAVFEEDQSGAQSTEVEGVYVNEIIFEIETLNK